MLDETNIAVATPTAEAVPPSSLATPLTESFVVPTTTDRPAENRVSAADLANTMPLDQALKPQINEGPLSAGAETANPTNMVSPTLEALSPLATPAAPSTTPPFYSEAPGPLGVGATQKGYAPEAKVTNPELSGLPPPSTPGTPPEASTTTETSSRSWKNLWGLIK